MTKLLSTLAGALVAIGFIALSATGASAHSKGCNCGPVAPTTHYKIVHPSVFKTSYHDVSVTKHVQRVHQITNVTEIQPIIHVHEVTRVHHHTVFTVRNEYASVTRHLTPISMVTHSVVNTYDCHCGW